MKWQLHWTNYLFTLMRFVVISQAKQVWICFPKPQTYKDILLIKFLMMLKRVQIWLLLYAFIFTFELLLMPDNELPVSQGSMMINHFRNSFHQTTWTWIIFYARAHAIDNVRICWFSGILEKISVCVYNCVLAVRIQLLRQENKSLKYHLLAV